MEFFHRMLKSTHPLLNVTLCCWFGCVYNTHPIVCVDCMYTILFCTHTHTRCNARGRTIGCMPSERECVHSLHRCPSHCRSIHLFSSPLGTQLWCSRAMRDCHTQWDGVHVFHPPAPLVHMTRVMCSNAGSCVHRCAIEVINVVFHDILLIDLCLDP